jgi:hypothetical protein
MPVAEVPMPAVRSRPLGVTGRNGAGASVRGEDPWLVREKWRLKPDF